MGRYQRTNRPMPIIGKTADNRPIPIIGASVLVTLTFTLDRVILHTVVHHSSTSTYMPNCIEIEESF